MITNEKIASYCTEFVRQHQLACDSLTEAQLAEAFRQALMAGDFMRQVVAGSNSQAVLYVPWNEVDRLRSLYEELICAVASKHEGETRHETALRYIREREAQPGVEGSDPKQA